MRTRSSQGFAVFLLSFLALGAIMPAAAADAAQPPRDASVRESPKTLASGLYMTGYNASFGTNYSSVTVTVDSIDNDSFTRTTGTLKIEYWSAITTPARAASFTGYRLATFNTIAPLLPRTYYEDLVRTSPMVVPPDGTYTFVLVLLEYDPANCTAADGYCMVDSLIGGQRTFGAPVGYALSVTLAGNASGTVTSNPAGITCGNVCSATFSGGTSVTLTATPGTGNTFAGWGGACSGTGNCVLTLNGATSVTATFNAAASSVANYSDIWWNPSESGWGLTIADHQTQLFAVWYTYRQDGSPTWFVIPGGTFTNGKRLFSGDIYQTTGPPYTGAFDSSQVRVTKVGTATFDFAPPGLAAGSALFNYTVGSVSQSKQIERQPFGNAPPDWGNDLTDIFWDPAESGWGLTVAQHGNNVFAVWYTYDALGQPLFLVMPGATFSGPDTFTGDLYTTTGPYYGNNFFDASQVRVTNVGSATLEFDPVAAAATTAATKAFLPNRKKGKFRPRVGGAVFNKWISPQGFGYAAPDTPPPACEVLYYDWSPCVNGSQARSERMRNPAGCSAASELTRACTAPTTPQSCTYVYTAFGSCQPGNTQSRTVVSSSPPGCTGTPTLTQACAYSPPCNYQYGPFGACISGVQTRPLLGATPAGCTGTPVLSQSCTGAQLPPGFPTNLTLGTYRLDISVCATLVGCFNSSQTLQNTDAQAFANQLVSVLNSSALGTAGCTSSTSYTGFNGSTFTATLTSTCTSGSASASSTVTIRVTKI